MILRGREIPSEFAGGGGTDQVILRGRDGPSDIAGGGGRTK